MKLSRNISIAIALVIISISIFVWILLLANPGNVTIKHCHVSASGPSATSLKMLLLMNPISSQLIGWGLMVIAMMLPKLIVPIQLIYSQSLKRYRFLNALLFVLGYMIIWMLAGVFMIAVIIGFNLIAPRSYIPAMLVFIAALIWQFAPIKQRFLNLGHDHRILSAFGWKSFRDALVYGLEHGVWCVGAGWALMLFPMLLPEGHNVVMLIVTFVMLSEHFEHPRFPKWEFNPRLRLFRIFIAQLKLLRHKYTFDL